MTEGAYSELGVEKPVSGGYASAVDHPQNKIVVEHSGTFVYKGFLLILVRFWWCTGNRKAHQCQVNGLADRRLRSETQITIGAKKCRMIDVFHFLDGAFNDEGRH